MAERGALPLARLLQLASPALPVGAFSYSQGLESATEAGIVVDRESAQCWIGDVARFSLSCWELPVLSRLVAAWSAGDDAAAALWNERFLASRESAELRAETVQMGYSLARLLGELEVVGASRLKELPEPSFPAAFAFAAHAWSIAPADALAAYLWSWLENATLAAVKCVPLGQTDAQRILLALGGHLDELVAAARATGDDTMANALPRLALLSARHETQYSRLFRS